MNYVSIVAQYCVNVCSDYFANLRQHDNVMFRNDSGFVSVCEFNFDSAEYYVDIFCSVYFSNFARPDTTTLRFEMIACKSWL